MESVPRKTKQLDKFEEKHYTLFGLVPHRPPVSHSAYLLGRKIKTKTKQMYHAERTFEISVAFFLGGGMSHYLHTGILETVPDHSMRTYISLRKKKALKHIKRKITFVMYFFTNAFRVLKSRKYFVTGIKFLNMMENTFKKQTHGFMLSVCLYFCNHCP